jgi:hypothetical protein
METTNNSNLDLFIQLIRGLDKEILLDLLNKSWEKDKLKTIAIIFNSRDRLNGKKEKEVSNFCLSWLKDNHNLIYKNNVLTYINKYGCWNDLNYIIKMNKKHQYEYKLFAEQLKEDLKNLEENGEISLCAKWAINSNKRDTIKLARLLFNNEIKNYHERYRKEYLIPLRNKLDLIETKICKNNWDDVDYSKIPAGALNFYKKIFKKKDNFKYLNFLDDVSNNKKKLKITGLLPHQIVSEYLTSLFEVNETLELQWKAFVNSYNDNNDNEDEEDNHIIPIVDVSGSMFSKTGNVVPITVSIAMGLLLAELNKGIYHNKIISFSENPTLIGVRGVTLREKILNIRNIDFGLNTDFLKTADLLINNNMRCKRIICLTDMQFDEGQNHNLFIEKFKKKNLEVPELIYWNLSGKYNNFPINDSETNTSIISGFSEQFLKIILEKSELKPDIIMNRILEPYYNNITI